MKTIYLSGIDGCGKTTQAKLLVDQLIKNGFNAKYIWFRWEPSFQVFINALRTSKDRGVFKKVQRVDKEPVEKRDWLKFKKHIFGKPFIQILWLHCACCDYYYYYYKKFNRLSAEVLVIDRYFPDFIIDQAVNFGIAPDKTSIISKNPFLKKFHLPDFNIFIDLPAEEGYRRKNDGTPLSYLEIREQYYLAINGNNTLHLNGLNSIDDLASQIDRWVSVNVDLIKV